MLSKWRKPLKSSDLMRSHCRFQFDFTVLLCVVVVAVIIRLAIIIVLSIFLSKLWYLSEVYAQFTFHIPKWMNFEFGYFLWIWPNSFVCLLFLLHIFYWIDIESEIGRHNIYTLISIHFGKQNAWHEWIRWLFFLLCEKSCWFFVKTNSEW